MSCKRSSEFLSKKVRSAKVPFTSGVTGSQGRDSFISLHDHFEIGVVPKGGTTNQVLAKCNNGNYNLHWIDVVTPPLPNALEELVIANTLFVMKNGDDSTGTRQRLDLPFLTIEAALNAASNADTVIVYPGTYTTDVLLIGNGANIHFLPGTIINVTDEDCITSSGVEKITGHGQFTFNTTPIDITTTYFYFEALTVNLGSFVINMFETSKIFINIVDVSYDGSFIIVDGSGGTNSTFDLKIDNAFKVNSAIAPFMTLKASSNYRIEIDKMFASSMSLNKSIFKLATLEGRLNIEVNSLICIQLDSEAETGYIIEDDNCLAYKNIHFNNIYVNCNLYGLTGGNNAIDKGTFSFKGTVFPLKEVSSLIDFSKLKQSCTFFVDIDVFFEEAQPGYTGNRRCFNVSKVLLNVADATYNQKLKGSIRVSTDDTEQSTGAVIEFGDLGSDLATHCAILDDLRIVTIDQYSIGFTNALSLAELPVIDVYANTADTGSPTYTIDASITVDSNVR